MITIIDYDAGNMKSVEKALLHLGEDVRVSRRAQDILQADKVILPGVGNFGSAMEKLREYGLIEIIRQVCEEGTPYLGICRGLQFFNVALGGTLYQDIPQQFPTTVNHHQDPPYDQPIHEVALTGGTPLQTILGCGSIGVNSCHHQGIKDLAPGLKAMAHAADGLVEAVYAPDKKCIWAVQWHPEFSHQVDQNSRRLFKAFVDVVVDGAAHSPVRNRSLMSG